MSSFRFTKLKITIGYVLMLAIVLFSLSFVYNELEKMTAADSQQSLITDSLLVLLREKDENTLRMLRVMSEASDSLLSMPEVEEIISVRDSIVTVKRVQHQVVTKRDTVLAPPEKKSFFQRLGEAFIPSRRDSSVLVNSSTEIATDTLIDSEAPPTDSLQEKLRMVTEEKRLQRKKRIRRTSTRYQRMNSELTARMDSLIQGYKESTALRASQEAALQQEARMRSARILAGIAAGSILLSVFFMVVIGRDITRSNRYRRELEEANRRAADLLAAREKMMLTITHDFKAPLGSIIGYTELLSRLTKDERQRFYLENMRSSSEHLLKLVRDLLDFHRLDLNKVEISRVAFNPAQLFGEIRTSFEPLTAEKGLELVCDVSPALSGNYVGDPLRLRQIANNLLSNAVKFTAKGSIRFRAAYGNSRLTMVVEDTGKGMAEKDCERIFQEFTRLPGAQGEEGFGLGLSIVKKLVDLLGGTIRVQSRLGEGSRFTVVLPLPPAGQLSGIAAEKAVGKAFPASRDVPAKPLRVLLIDDDRIQLQLTEAMLTQSGMTVACCGQVDDLFERLRTEEFDVLLTDIQMPAMNGFDLLKLLRASNYRQAKSIPVVAVTARSEMDEAQLTAHGFAGCLHKPFTASELQRVVLGVRQPEPSAASSDAPAVPASPRAASPAAGDDRLNIAALTAYSGDDEAAGKAIVESFVAETEKSIGRMRRAVDEKNLPELAAVAHKLLPLFSLVGAGATADSLRRLEGMKGASFSGEAAALAEKALHGAALVLEKAREYIAGHYR